jgi:signal transduction histidine kinase
MASFRSRRLRWSQPQSAAPDAVLRLDAEFAEIMALLDGSEATRRIVGTVPDGAGVDIAWFGDPTGPDKITLRHVVHSATGQIEGLVVPIGAGLGGKVLAARRPLWVSDYCNTADISPHFKTEVGAEGIKAMIAVPIMAGERLLGVLYGANHNDNAFGDRATDALQRMAARTAMAQVVAERAQHAAEVAVHDERRRLALDLHDSVGAMLFTLGAGIRRLGAESGLDKDIRTRLSVIEQQAAEAAAALRGSLRILSTPPEPLALCVALREHCRAFQERTGVPARLITLTDLPPMNAARSAALADTTRESLLNAEKHAQANVVIVTVFAGPDGVAVTISDDGVGLSAAARGLGLAAATDTVARVGGTLTVSANDDGGVTVRAWIPR